MMRNMVRPWACLAAVSLLATGCAETQLGLQLAKSASRDNSEPRDALPVNNDATIAPEEFDATGLTIWDGARTLQGVWIAHPLANRARRVRVINTVSGRTVEGAMFRRDPSLSGPSILVSSDAAYGLGLRPGDPTALRIVALRDASAQPAPTATASTTNVTTPAPAAVETAALPEPAPAPATTFEPAPSPAPANGGVLTPAPVAPSAVSPAPAPVPVPVATPAPTATDTAPEPSLVAVTSSPKPTPRPVRQTSARTAQQAAPRSDEQLPAGDYVQAGAFGVEPNAVALVTKLRAKGLPAQFVKREVNGAKLNIVMIGPLFGAPAIERAKTEAASAGVAGARKVTL